MNQELLLRIIRQAEEIGITSDPVFQRKFIRWTKIPSEIHENDLKSYLAGKVYEARLRGSTDPFYLPGNEELISKISDGNLNLGYLISQPIGVPCNIDIQKDFVIGLYASSGQGKSSIIFHLLNQILNNENEDNSNNLLLEAPRISTNP